MTDVIDDQVHVLIFPTLYPSMFSLFYPSVLWDSSLKKHIVFSNLLMNIMDPDDTLVHT